MSKDLNTSTDGSKVYTNPPSICLHTAAVTNEGFRSDAGVTLLIGDEPDQINADSAATLIASGLAAAA